MLWRDWTPEAYIAKRRKAVTSITGALCALRRPRDHPIEVQESLRGTRKDGHASTRRAEDSCAPTSNLSQEATVIATGRMMQSNRSFAMAMVLVPTIDRALLLEFTIKMFSCWLSRNFIPIIGAKYGPVYSISSAMFVELLLCLFF